MKKSLKNQNGAVIVVILVIILALAVAGAAFLGIRMAVTGEHFLQPLANLGWIELDDEDEEKADAKKDSKKDDDEDVTVDEEKSSKKASGSVDKSRLSAEAKKSDVDHYYGSMTMADSEEALDEEFADIYKLLTLEVNLYARDNKAVEVVFTVKMKDFLKKMYEEYGDEFSSEGYESYEDFEKDMMPVFESAFDFGFDQSAGDEDYSAYINKYVEDGNIQVYITEEGFASLYESYDIDEEDGDIETIIEAIEDSMGIKIEKVN